MTARRTFLVALTSALCLPGCGFRLAGTAELPTQLASLFLELDNFDERQRAALRSTLESAGAKLAVRADDQAARLRVVLKPAPDRQLATSASSGEIVRRVSRGLDFNVRGADGNFIVPPRSLNQQRDMVLDENNLLASNRERDAVARELEQALYEQMLRQLTGL